MDDDVVIAVDTMIQSVIDDHISIIPSDYDPCILLEELISSNENAVNSCKIIYTFDHVCEVCGKTSTLCESLILYRFVGDGYDGTS